MGRLNKLTAAVLVLAVTMGPASTNADLIVLNFLTNGIDGAAFDFDDDTGVFTTNSTNHGISGIELTFTAIVAGNTGNLNATTSNFGINATPSGDDTDELDMVNGAETVRISFVAPGTVTNISLQSIAIGDFGTMDAGTLTIGANSSSIASGSSTVIPMHTNLDGQFLEVAFTGMGNGFGFNGLTLDVTAIPEPGSFLLGGAACGVVGLAVAIRRRIGRPQRGLAS